MISRRPLHGFPAAVDRGFIIAGARCRMTHSQQKYADVDFTVIQQDPEIPNAGVETVVARRMIPAQCFAPGLSDKRSEEHTSELQSPVPISYAVFCLKKKKKNTTNTNHDRL